MMVWRNGVPGWTGWLLMSVGIVAFWVMTAIAIIALLPGVRNDRAERKRRWLRSGGLR